MTVPRKDDLPASRTVARPVANLGNTCYMNAVLQALAHAPELCLAMDCEAHRSTCPIAAENKEKLQRSTSPDGSATSNESETKRPTAATRKSRRSGRRTPPEQENSANAIKFCALCELEEHLSSVHDLSKTDKPVAPSSFVNGFIDQVAPWFKLGVQEDSHEFLRLLIDAMQKSCEKARPQPGNPQEDGAAASSATPEEADKDTEYPFSLFRGTVESTVTCGFCEATSSKLDPIEDIGLEVAAPSPAAATRTGERSSSRNVSPVPAPTLYDVETAFHKYSDAEALDSGYKCEKCGKVGKATKQSKLASIPPILTLHLKRFRYGAGAGIAEGGGRRSRSELGQLLGSSDLYGKSGSAKIEGHIKFNVLFDLQPFLTEELQGKQANMLCRLFAVIVHAGKNSHSGHYIAYVRNLAKNEWWKMDDGRVTHVPVNEVTNAEAYMLFYRVVQHPVATKLEQDYQTKLESIRSQGENRSAGDANKIERSPSSELLNLRKRPLPPPGDVGETWYRNKTSMPPHLMKLIQALEEQIAGDAVFREDFMKRIREGTTTGPTEEAGEDIVEGIDQHGRKVAKVLYQAFKWLEDQNAISSSSQLLEPPVTAPSESKQNTITDDKRVAVVAVVEEEEIDLL